MQKNVRGEEKSLHTLEVIWNVVVVVQNTQREHESVKLTDMRNIFAIPDGSPCLN